jgi:hypothetical protein
LKVSWEKRQKDENAMTTTEFDCVMLTNFGDGELVKPIIGNIKDICQDDWKGYAICIVDTTFERISLLLTVTVV